MTTNHRFAAYRRAAIAWKNVGRARLGLMDATTAVTDAIAAGRPGLSELDAFVASREHARSAAAGLIVAPQAVVATLPAIVDTTDHADVLAARGPLAGDPLPHILHVGAVRADAADQLTAAGFNLGTLVQEECAAIDVDAVGAVLAPRPRRLTRAAAAAVLAAGLVVSGGAAANAATTDTVTCAADETDLVAVADTPVMEVLNLPAWRVTVSAGDHVCGTTYNNDYKAWEVRIADGREGVAYSLTLIDAAYAPDSTATTQPDDAPAPGPIPTVTVTVTVTPEATPAESPAASAEPTAEPDAEEPAGIDWDALLADAVAFLAGVPVPVWIATAGGVLLVAVTAAFLRRKKGDDDPDTGADTDDDAELDPAPAPNVEPMTRPRRPASSDDSNESEDTEW